MQSMKTLKEADPHDVFAIETILAARGDRAPPLAHDAVGHPGGAQGAPEISIGIPAAQIEPAFHAADVSDIPIENIRPVEIKIDGMKGLGERPTAKWVRRVVMALLGLAGATAAAAWQHYGDQAKAMAVEWAPPFVIAALAPAEKPAAAEQPNVTAVRAAAADQAAPADQPAAQPVATAQPEQAAAPAATATPAESTQLQSMARDLAAMSQQVEELKASIAQLKAGQAQMSRETAKAAEPRTSEARPAENVRPRVTAAAPPPRPTAAPVRRPTPAYPPAQAAYVPPLPPVPAPVQSQPAPPPQQTIADDGEPIVRPPMPVR
jgi:hypothetical protein